MKKIVTALGLAALCFSAFLAPSAAQTTPSGRSIVYPQENPPSVDTVLQPARFTRLALGAFFMHSLNLTTAGAGEYANCTTAPASGLYVTIAPTVSNTLCGIYQVNQDDVTAMPVGVSPQLSPDPTLIVIQALQAGTTTPIGPFTPPGSNSVYYLIEAQLQTTDTANAARAFYNPLSGTFANQTVATQRLDAIAYQTKQGTAGVTPGQPSADSGWFPFAYVLVPSGATHITNGMLSAGNVLSFAGAVSSVNGAGTVACSPTSGNVVCTGTNTGVSAASPAPSPFASITPPSNNVGTVAIGGTVQANKVMFSSPDPNGNNYAIDEGCNSGSGWNSAYSIGFYAGISPATTAAQPACQYTFSANISSNYVFALGQNGTSGYMCTSRDDGGSLNNNSCIGESSGINGTVCWNATGFSNLGTPLFRMCLLSANPAFIFDTNGRFHTAEDVYSTGIVSMASSGATTVAGPTPGDGWFSQSVSSGAIHLGGNTGGSFSALNFDYGVTTPGVGTIDKSLALTQLTPSQGVCTDTNKKLVSCATPGPQTTPSPNVTATPCAATPSASGSSPYNINVPAGCVASVAATGNLNSTGGTTPTITMTAAPTFSGTVSYSSANSQNFTNTTGASWNLYATGANDALDLFEQNGTLPTGKIVNLFAGATSEFSVGQNGAVTSNGGTSSFSTLNLTNPLGTAYGGTGTASPANTFNSPLSATGSFGSYSISCTPCVTTAGSQTIAGTTTFSGGTPLAFSNTGGAVFTDAATTVNIPFSFNATGSPSSNLFNVELGGTNEFVVTNGGGGTFKGPVQGSVPSGTQTYYIPAYTVAGAAVASTEHCINDHFTASGTSTTVTLSGSAAFSSASYFLSVWDTTAQTAATVTAQSATGYTYTSTVGHIYAYNACGT